MGMADVEFLKVFKEKRQEFTRQLEQGNLPGERGRGRINRSSDRLLDWFEKWLEDEALGQEQRRQAPAMPFEDFLNLVLEETTKILSKKDPTIKEVLANGSSNTWKRFSKSWKCLNIFDDSEIFYKIGKTTPRKGPRQGKEFLVLELVLDGRKKQAFLPMLAQKKELEDKLGSVLEREPPRVEATGKYRFKLFLPYDLAYNGEVGEVAEKMAGMILATRPVLNELGIN